MATRSEIQTIGDAHTAVSWGAIFVRRHRQYRRHADSGGVRHRRRLYGDFALDRSRRLGDHVHHFRRHLSHRGGDAGFHHRRLFRRPATLAMGRRPRARAVFPRFGAWLSGLGFGNGRKRGRIREAPITARHRRRQRRTCSGRGPCRARRAKFAGRSLCRPALARRPGRYAAAAATSAQATSPTPDRADRHALAGRPDRRRTGGAEAARTPRQSRRDLAHPGAGLTQGRYVVCRRPHLSGQRWSAAPA